MSVDPRVAAARFLRLSATLLAIGATLSWITPRNVSGKNLMPFGCGAPASPTTSEIADFVCADALSSAKALSVCLVVSAGLLLLISEAMVPNYWPRPWARGIAMAAPVAVPIMAVSTVRLVSTAGTVGADGTLVRCGTPVAPARDPISRYVCGQLPDTERYLGVGGLILGVVLLIGAIYIAAAWHGDRTAVVAAQSDDPTGPGTIGAPPRGEERGTGAPTVSLADSASGFTHSPAPVATRRWEDGR